MNYKACLIPPTVTPPASPSRNRSRDGLAHVAWRADQPSRGQIRAGVVRAGEQPAAAYDYVLKPAPKTPSQVSHL
jgi:hypothetical protein